MLSACYLSTIYEKSFAFDRPVHSAVAILTLCGLCMILAERLRALLPSTSDSQQYSAVPLQELRVSHSRESSTGLDGALEELRIPTPSLRRRRITWMLLVMAICVRVEVLRRVVQNVQCNGRTFEVCGYRSQLRVHSY